MAYRRLNEYAKIKDMMFLEFLRNKAFWTLDSLKGSPVKHALLKIKGLEQEETCDEVL